MTPIAAYLSALLVLAPVVLSAEDIGTPATAEIESDTASAIETIPHIIPGQLSSGASVAFGPLTGEGQGPQTATGSPLSISGLPLGPGPAVVTTRTDITSGIPSGSIASGTGAVGGSGSTATSNAISAAGSGNTMITATALASSSTTPAAGADSTSSAMASSAASAAESSISAARSSGSAASTASAGGSVPSAGAARERKVATGALVGVIGLAMVL